MSACSAAVVPLDGRLAAERCASRWTRLFSRSLMAGSFLSHHQHTPGQAHPTGQKFPPPMDRTTLSRAGRTRL